MKSREKKQVLPLVFVLAALLMIANLAVTGVRENQREDAGLREAQNQQALAEEKTQGAGAGRDAAGDPSGTGGGNTEGTSAAAGSGSAEGAAAATVGGSTGGSNTRTGGINAGSVPSSPTIPQSQRIVAGNVAGASGAATDPGSQVTEVRLTGTTTQMLQAETLQLLPTILPESAASSPLTFRSSNEVVAKVTGTGLVTSLRGGNVVISASAPNGITCEYPITVSSTQAHMILQITTEYPSDSDGSGDWQFSYRINGSSVSGGEEYIVTLGDVYAFVTNAVSSGGRSTGDVEGSFTIDESGLEGGFTAVQEFIVEDTRPDHRGESTSFTVTYRFSRAFE